MEIENDQEESIYFSDEDQNCELKRSKEDPSSTQLYTPEEDDSPKSKRDSKKTDKKIQKQRIRNKGQRKNKNTFGNMLGKLYRVALKDLNFKYEIQEGKLGKDVSVIPQKKPKKGAKSKGNSNDKETIFISMENRLAKSEMQIFLYKIRVGFSSLEKEIIQEKFLSSVERSILFQRKQKIKIPNYAEACEETIGTLFKIKKLIVDYLSEKDPNFDQLTQLTLSSQKADKYNNGVKQIQKLKKDKIQKELKNVQPIVHNQRTVNLLMEPEIERLINGDQQSLYDVLVGHQVSDWPFEAWSNDINHYSD